MQTEIPHDSEQIAPADTMISRAIPPRVCVNGWLVAGLLLATLLTTAAAKQAALQAEAGVGFVLVAATEWLLFWGGAAWVALDSSRIGFRRFQSGIRYSPPVLFCLSAALWVPAVAWYCDVRSRVLKGQLQPTLAIPPASTGKTVVAYAFVAAFALWAMWWLLGIVAVALALAGLIQIPA